MVEAPAEAIRPSSASALCSTEQFVVSYAGVEGCGSVLQQSPFASSGRVPSQLSGKVPARGGAVCWSSHRSSQLTNRSKQIAWGEYVLIAPSLVHCQEN